MQAHLIFAPTGVKRKGALSNVPVTGEVVGHYDGRIEVVNIAALTLRTPSSSLVTSGVLFAWGVAEMGVLPGDAGDNRFGSSP